MLRSKTQTFAKGLIVLLLFLMPSITILGQDTETDFITVEESIQKRATEVLEENEILGEHKLQDLKLYAARKTKSGYNFIYRHVIDDFEVEGDAVKLMLNANFQMIYSDVQLSTVNIENDSTIPEAKIIETVKNHEYLIMPMIRSSRKVIAKLKGAETWSAYYRVEVKDREARVHLYYYVATGDGSIAAITHTATKDVYTKGSDDGYNKPSGVNSVCCDNANENGRYHIVDPNTTVTCSDVTVSYHPVGQDFLLGSSTDAVTFANDQAPIANEDGIFCYDFDTKDYNILHSYIYTTELLASGITDAPTAVDLDVDGSMQPFVTTGSSSDITFGSNMLFDDLAADRFHVAHGFFQLVAKNKVSTLLDLSTSGGLGSIDYLVMDHYVLDGNCYNFGGIDQLQNRRTDYTSYTTAINATSNTNSNQAQTWSSYLMRIKNGLPPTSGIGQGDTENLLYEVIDAVGNNIQQNILMFFAKAKEANYIDNEELCRIYNITNDYMTGVSGFNITLSDLPDYYIKDSSVDVGDEPYWLPQMWTSPSIWNTVGSPTGPIGNPETGTTNYLHVKVEDRNGIQATDKVLHVYFSMASLGLTWPDDWMNQVINGQQVSGELTPQPITGPDTFVFAWTPPDPSALNISDKHHVCILARITDENNTVRNQNCDLEGSGVGNNTNRFNSIAWRNLSIIDTNGLIGGGIKEERVSVFVENTNPPEWYEDTDDTPVDIDMFTLTLEINPTPINPNILEVGEPDPNFFEHCEVFVEFNPEFGIPTPEEGYTGQGFQVEKDGSLRITSSDFKLTNLKMHPDDTYLLTTIYKPIIKNNKIKPVSFSLVLHNFKEQVVGGELYQCTYPKTPRIGGEMLDISKSSKEVRSMAGQLKILPNPTHGIATILAPKAMMSLDIVDSQGSMVERQKFDNAETTKYTVDLQNQLTGIFTVRVQYQDGSVESVNLVKK